MFGINLSMPYKEKVIPFLDGLSPEAQLIGAVNTVVNRDGRLTAIIQMALAFLLV